MSEIKVITAYNLVNANGTKLQLRLGVTRYGGRNGSISNGDECFRWSFNGKEIPMPVRSGYWFSGFPEHVMMNWLKGNGWALRSRVDMATGKATVYELPSVEEPSKGNEKSIADYPALDPTEKCIFDYVIRYLADGEKKAIAARLYRYVHGGTLRNAYDAVQLIITE